MNTGNLKLLAGFIILLVVAGFIFIWTGLFNIAATEKHWGITNSVLELVRERSIRANAPKIDVPDLADAERIRRGAANFDAMCAQCHLAPGMDTSELHEGLYPQPPVLYKTVNEELQPHETFWVIKHGLKLTGMPAWGNYNSDEQIWDMIAVIKAMQKGMSAEKYQELVASGEHTHAKGGGHGDTAPEHHHGNNNHHAAPVKKKKAPHTHAEGASPHHH